MGTSRDLALNSSTYDLSIVGQDLAPLITDYDAIVSDLTAVTKFMLGEWFLDLSQGLPWLQVFGTKPLDTARLRAALFAAYQARPGVSQVLSVTISALPNRTATITWVVLADATQLNAAKTLTGTVSVP